MKLVGNPVFTAGKGVKKFCSSMMQDLLTPESPGNNDTCKASQEESDYNKGFIDSKNMEENEFYMNGERPVEEDGCPASRVNQGTANYVHYFSPVERQVSNVNETQPQDGLSQMKVSCHSATTEMTLSLKVEKPHSDTYRDYEHIEPPCDGPDRSLSPDMLLQMNASCNSTITELTSSLLVERRHSDPYYEYEHIETSSDGLDRSSTFESAKGELKLSTDISEDALANSAKSPSVTDLDNPTNVIVGKTVDKSEQN